MIVVDEPFDVDRMSFAIVFGLHGACVADGGGLVRVTPYMRDLFSYHCFVYLPDEFGFYVNYVGLRSSCSDCCRSGITDMQLQVIMTITN